MAQGAWRHPPNLRQPEGLWGSLGLPGVFGLPWATLGEPQLLWEGLDYPGLRGCLLALWAIGVFPDAVAHALVLVSCGMWEDLYTGTVVYYGLLSPQAVIS